VTSLRFRIGSVTRQGGVIPPYLFACYIRELFGSCAVLACFAVAVECVTLTVHFIDMSCNVNKTVCMMFKLKRQSSIILAHLPPLRIGVSCVQYVSNILVILLWTICPMMVIFVGKSDVCSHDVIC